MFSLDILIAIVVSMIAISFVTAVSIGVTLRTEGPRPSWWPARRTVTGSLRDRLRAA